MGDFFITLGAVLAAFSMTGTIPIWWGVWAAYVGLGILLKAVWYYIRKNHKL